MEAPDASKGRPAGVTSPCFLSRFASVSGAETAREVRLSKLFSSRRWALNDAVTKLSGACPTPAARQPGEVILGRGSWLLVLRLPLVVFGLFAFGSHFGEFVLFPPQAARNSLGWTSISDLGHPPHRSLNISQESTDSARVVHSLDSPATLPVKSGLQVRF